MRGKGSQKKARLERLKNEIIDYVTQAPGASAADIVAFLSNERKMRNHGLTTRKVGLFILINFDDLLFRKTTWNQRKEEFPIGFVNWKSESAYHATEMGARHLPVDGTSLAFTVPRMMGSRGNPNRGISPAVTYYDMRKHARD